MESQNPQVSVGLPVYNGERFLRQTLESIVVQTFSDIEVVISDNASTDTTEAICRELAARDIRIKYHRQQVNHGPFWNFSRVCRLSRGQYFLWMAYDDILLPTYIERCVGVLDKDPEVVLCYSQMDDIDEDNNPVASSMTFADASSPLPENRFAELMSMAH